MKKIIGILFLFLGLVQFLSAQSIIQNPYGRQNAQSLNGKWDAIIDPFSRGEETKFYLLKTPQKKSDFVEYSFDNTLQLDVPGDFNSQLPELKYYEGNIWYRHKINITKQNSNRKFIYFAGANYLTTVWLNGVQIGKHEGGFTAFQFEISMQLKEGENNLVVLVNNNRKVDGIPAMNFDWWNYGGILRDVFLIETPTTYISDYQIQLKKNTPDLIQGYVKLEGATITQTLELAIPELKIKQKLTTDENGLAVFEIKSKPVLWEPSNPKLYKVTVSTNADVVSDEIGFRTIETKGRDILLNGKSIFLKGVNFHEEIPQRLGRAYSEADAVMILSEVKALGCNFARTAHYPQNERIVRLAEKMGIMLWEEIPLWQGIEFTNPVILGKAKNMLQDMICRDKNRAGIIIWSIANETRPSEGRDKVLIDLVSKTHELDNSRLVSAAFDNLSFDKDSLCFKLNDNLAKVVDIVGINKYLGWYTPFPTNPEKIKWNIEVNKPLIMSEFGGESLYGQHGSVDVAQSWSEEYQEEIYKNNLIAFKNIPNLRGTTPWVLFDFRSPRRLLPNFQDGWNRKGLVSDKGLRKKAWYIMKKYYEEVGK